MNRIQLAKRLLILTLTMQFFSQEARPHDIEDKFKRELKPIIKDIDIPKQSGEFDPQAVEGVVDLLKLWEAGAKLKVCFFEGNQEMKSFFVKSSEDWLAKKPNISFDFGESPSYNKCGGNQSYHIRVSFLNNDKNESLIGTDSLRVDQSEPSLNISYGANSYDLAKKDELKRIILHELGHALALEHEHQSPEAKCDAEFDWDTIYPYFKERSWDKTKVDFNLGTLMKSKRYRTTSYDKKSIMHYFFPAWMFKTKEKSACYTEPNNKPSDIDLELIAAMYPESQAHQIKYINSRAEFAKQILTKLVGNKEQTAYVEKRVNEAASKVNKEINFHLTTNTTFEQNDCNAKVDINGGEKNIGIGCQSGNPTFNME